MKIRFMIVVLCLTLLFVSCGTPLDDNKGYTNPETQGTSSALGDDSTSFGSSLDDLGAYDGYFEGESTDIVVECVSGTDKAYKLEGTTLTFTGVGEESVYSISGKLRGNIVIDVGEGYKFDLELHGLSLVCNSTNPITVISGDEVAIKAKKDTKNYIYDMRAAIDTTDETLYSGAIH
ncbi:MAG: carbohydrate-binding domain-containing protein, partial [Clostridia bacterium]|nr:carbohydrate-binding domain-containing protein [Clostridia bacterium]